jgi:DNA-binding NarL/FixJ family response regulator
MPIEAAGETRCSKIRVILVEDHALTRMRLATVLGQGPGIELVDHADNGQTAIELVEKHRPDVVLMDVGLPVMDGIEAASTIRKLFPEVKIVMLTAHDNDGDVFAALAAGAGGYCLKNMEPERLYRAIISVNDGDLWLDSGIASKVVKLYSPLSAKDNTRASEIAVPAVLDGEGKTGESGSLQELPDPLSPREMEVLNLLVNGLSNQQIADNLIISLATTKSHVRSILNKLAVDDRTQAAVHAMRRGLV